MPLHYASTNLCRNTFHSFATLCEEHFILLIGLFGEYLVINCNYYTTSTKRNYLCLSAPLSLSLSLSSLSPPPVGTSIDLCMLLTGKRPFGVSLLYMGWDKHYGYQLYQSDPSGNYGGWKATCIGNNSAVSI